jgi:hypothetical protein
MGVCGNQRQRGEGCEERSSKTEAKPVASALTEWEPREVEITGDIVEP